MRDDDAGENRIPGKTGKMTGEGDVRMKRSKILLVDAAISLVLGVALAVFPNWLAELLGLPPAETKFYPSLLGAVVTGVAIALFVEWKHRPAGAAGLGVWGAIAIDLCAAVALAGWLVFGGLNLPVRGQILLWSITALLVIVSGFGLAANRTRPAV